MVFGVKSPVVSTLHMKYILVKGCIPDQPDLADLVPFQPPGAQRSAEILGVVARYLGSTSNGETANQEKSFGRVIGIHAERLLQSCEVVRPAYICFQNSAGPKKLDRHR